MNELQERICVCCGNRFYSRFEKAKYCGKKCANSSRYKRSIDDIKQRQKKILELAEKGETVEQITNTLGYKRVTSVSNYLRQRGIPCKWEKQLNRCQRDEKILEMRRNGYSMKAISDRLGVLLPTVSDICRKNGYGGKITESNDTGTVYEMRFCKECNAVFFCDPTSNRIFCSDKCQKANNHKRHDQIRRARKRNALINEDITLDNVAKKENDICYLCGQKVDWNDYRIINGKKCALGNYPSVEHVVALSNGGKHEWKNVRLAHIRCNASKGVSKIG